MWRLNFLSCGGGGLQAAVLRESLKIGPRRQKYARNDVDERCAGPSSAVVLPLQVAYPILVWPDSTDLQKVADERARRLFESACDGCRDAHRYSARVRRLALKVGLEK